MEFYSKKGRILIEITELILNIEIGENLPAIENLRSDFDVSRGTIQNTLKYLEENEIIKISKRGRNGTVLIEKDVQKLLDLKGKTNYFGILTIPYTPRYVGLATGLKQVLRDMLKKEVHLSFDRNSSTRVLLLKENRVDFAVFSKKHAEKILSENDDICLITNLKNKSYLESHVIVKSKINQNKIVGVDANSYVHSLLVEEFFPGYVIKHVPYNQLEPLLISGEISCTILNEANINIDNVEIIPIKEDESYLSASILTNKKNSYLKSILDCESLVNEIDNIQNQVIEKKIFPSYWKHRWQRCFFLLN